MDVSVGVCMSHVLCVFGAHVMYWADGISPISPICCSLRGGLITAWRFISLLVTLSLPLPPDQLRDCYFANLAPFDAAALRQQRDTLQGMLDGIAGVFLSVRVRVYSVCLGMCSVVWYLGGGYVLCVPARRPPRCGCACGCLCVCARVRACECAVCGNDLDVSVALHTGCVYASIELKLSLTCYGPPLFAFSAVGKQHKNRRRTLHNQIQRIQEQLCALEAGRDTYVCLRCLPFFPSFVPLRSPFSYFVLRLAGLVVLQESGNSREKGREGGR